MPAVISQALTDWQYGGRPCEAYGMSPFSLMGWRGKDSSAT